jgi:hypothetical protein
MTTPAEKFLLEQKDNFFWTLLTSADGLQISGRFVFLHYNPKGIVFFILYFFLFVLFLFLFLFLFFLFFFVSWFLYL